MIIFSFVEKVPRSKLAQRRHIATTNFLKILGYDDSVRPYACSP